ncbi:hypothetical protein HMPREF9718_02146 [Sphingobium yanoikuyae ATCC 51230]|uniref:SMODS and SLOG-associating 2TM effector domain-containing protein n=2 Tax=Sphingobium yanoikuyae TaxID=13690 RepID=K9CRN1_SPHYA|nr:hypothetical protein HMPREF9718_02146 [Sphingobium yanoikuyae ATCC 51230]
MTDGDFPRLVRDEQRYSDSLSKSHLPAARARYDYLLERRDKIQDQLRIGAMAVNAASLLGVLTALGTNLVSQSKFGVSISDLAYSAACFMLGTILAGAGAVIESWRVPGEAAEQFDRLSREESLRASLDTELNDLNRAQFIDQRDYLHELPPADFGYSLPAAWATTFAYGAWLAGMIMPLWRLSAMIKWLN